MNRWQGKAEQYSNDDNNGVKEKGEGLIQGLLGILFWSTLVFCLTCVQGHEEQESCRYLAGALFSFINLKSVFHLIFHVGLLPSDIILFKLLAKVFLTL